MDIHLNTSIMTGISLMAGSFPAAFLMLFLFQSWEIGAFAPAGVVFFALLISGIVLIVLGIGMNIR